MAILEKFLGKNGRAQIEKTGHNGSFGDRICGFWWYFEINRLWGDYHNEERSTLPKKYFEFFLKSEKKVVCDTQSCGWAEKDVKVPHLQRTF